MAVIIPYRTRDGSGNDIIKNVVIKEFPVVDVDITCPTCNKPSGRAVEVKKAVSGSFTDWAFVDRYICPECAKLLSLYFYNYSMEAGEVCLFNVREIYSNLMRKHKTPFKFIISTSQKKHLFYRAVENYSDDYFAVQLETETIFTDRGRMGRLFDFIESLQALGATKGMMAEGKLPIDIVMSDGGIEAYEFLRREIKDSREIQIPLYCGQKRDITEEEARCILISTLTAGSELGPHC